MRELDSTKVYRLVSVTDRQGRDKKCSSFLYSERINCLATNFHYDEQASFLDKRRLRMHFIEDENGNSIYRPLHTSPVLFVDDADNGMIVYTCYSIYTFKEVAH